MKRSVQLFVFLFILFSHVFSSAQDKPIIGFTEDDGLASNEVHDVTKDNQGYLWIATGNGVSKYDGEKFMNFRVQQGLPGNIVRAVAHDENNRIYVACYKSGLAVIENDRIVKILHISAFENDKIRKLHYSNTHHLLFVGTDYGLYVLKDSTFILLSSPNKVEGQSSILSIIEQDGTIYYTNYDSSQKGKGLFKIDINTENISKSKVTKIVGGNNGLGCTSMDGSIFANLDLNIYKYQPKTGEISNIVRSDTLFLCWAMAPMGSHKIVLGGRSEGPFVADIKILDVITNKISDSPFNLKTPNINNIVFDEKDKCTWFCCDMGLYCFKDSPFEIYNIADKSSILDITVKNDSLYILTEDHIWTFENGKQKLLFDKDQLQKKILEKSYLYLSNLTENKGKPIRTLNRIYDKKVKFLHFNTDGDQQYLLTYMGAISIPDLCTFLPVRDGHFVTDEKQRILWVPPYYCLYCYPTVTTSAEVLPFDFHQGKPIKDVKKILKIGEITYFASFFNGLYALKGDKIFYLNSSNSELDNTLSDIDSDNKGNIWCTSTTGNLYKIDFTDKLNLVKTFYENNSKIIGDNYKWLKFNSNYLYVGTNKGLNKIPIDQLNDFRIDSVLFFNKANGYEYISNDAPKIDSQGNVYVFTPERIIKILNTNSYLQARDISISEIWVDNNPLTSEQINEMKLSSNTKSISIGFSVFKLPSSKNMEYRYKINDGDWYMGNRISLQSLKSGKYVIVCQAKDHETSINYEKTIQFQINKPLWQSWWFLILSVLLIVAVTYWLLYARFSKASRQKEEKARLSREIAELHLQSLRSQMNPHFVFNSLNSIQNFILSNNIEEAVTYLGTLGSLIRLNLEHVSKEYISLSDEIKFLEKYIEIEKMRFKEELVIKTTVKVTDIEETILPPMLIQPIIENSIKYRSRSASLKGMIQIEFLMENNVLVVLVTDNGIGRVNSRINKSDHHKSMGLSLITKRLSLLNEKFNTNKFSISITDLHKDGSPSGTKVQVAMPQFYSEN